MISLALYVHICSNDFPRFSHDFPMNSHDFPMIFPWIPYISHGFLMNSPWFPYISPYVSTNFLHKKRLLTPRWLGEPWLWDECGRPPNASRRHRSRKIWVYVYVYIYDIYGLYHGIYGIIMVIYGYYLFISGWWFGTFFIFPYIGNNHPNWLIFFRGVETTNQIYIYMVYIYTYIYNTFIIWVWPNLCNSRKIML